MKKILSQIKRKLWAVDFCFVQSFAIVIVLILIILVTTSGCGNNEKQVKDKINIVTTTTMLCDLAQNIGGEGVEVAGLMGPGVDPHLYKASAGDIKKLEEADLIIYNGLHLEGAMIEALEAMELQGKTILSMENGLDKSLLIEADGVGEELYDPHIWFDVSLWNECADYLSKQLQVLDEENKDLYQSNYSSYTKELATLHIEVQEKINTLEEEEKILITAHDAFGYFAKAYGMEVYAIQGISTQTEASTKDMANLSNFIVEHTVKGIFLETSVSSKNVEALQESVRAKGWEVKIGGALYSDSLGDEKEGTQTYIKTVQANVNTIVEGLK